VTRVVPNLDDSSDNVRAALRGVLTAMREHTSHVPDGSSTWMAAMCAGLALIERRRGLDALDEARDALVSTIKLLPRENLGGLSVGPWTRVLDMLHVILAQSGVA
jgi:hypothetical protein